MLEKIKPNGKTDSTLVKIRQRKIISATKKKYAVSSSLDDQTNCSVKICNVLPCSCPELEREAFRYYASRYYLHLFILYNLKMSLFCRIHGSVTIALNQWFEVLIPLHYLTNQKCKKKTSLEGQGILKSGKKYSNKQSAILCNNRKDWQTATVVNQRSMLKSYVEDRILGFTV